MRREGLYREEGVVSKCLSCGVAAYPSHPEVGKQMVIKAASSDSFALHLPHRYFSCQKEVNLVKDLLCFPEQ